jgi:hypothetical protein
MPARSIRCNSESMPSNGRVWTATALGVVIQHRRHELFALFGIQLRKRQRQHCARTLGDHWTQFGQGQRRASGIGEHAVDRCKQIWRAIDECTVQIEQHAVNAMQIHADFTAHAR